jgi:hypothetical protein
MYKEKNPLKRRFRDFRRGSGHGGKRKITIPLLTIEPNTLIWRTLFYHVIYYMVIYKAYKIITFCKTDLNYLNKWQGSVPSQVKWDLRKIYWHSRRFSLSILVSPANAHFTNWYTLINHPIIDIWRRYWQHPEITNLKCNWLLKLRSSVDLFFAYFPLLRGKRRLIRLPACVVCMCECVPHLKFCHLTNFHEICYVHYATEDHFNVIVHNSLQ